MINASTQDAGSARPLIAARAVSKSFSIGRGRTIHAVREASFEVAGGEIFGLLGPNGAGKTTLLRMLATIITPTSGHCEMNGVRTDVDPQGVRRTLGFLSGNTKLYQRLKAREMLAYFGRLYGMSEPAIANRTAELAELLDMGAFLDRRCGQLSTGQSQKVSIARVLLHDPGILILDEPTLGLDIMTSRAILGFISQARARGRAIIFSTHYMTEAELLCDRIGFIHAGRIMAMGTKQELYERTGADNLVDAFVAMAEREGQQAA